MVCVIVFSAGLATASDQPQLPPAGFQETMTPLGRAISGEEVFLNSITISPDLKHLAYVSRIGPFFRVWHDGVAEKTYQGISQDSPFFSRNNRLAFIALEDDHMYAVVDNQARDRHAQAGDFTFSPDGSRFAYRAENIDREQFVVVDGKEGPDFPIGVPPATGIVFSPDSTRVAYVGIERDGSHTFVLNHKKTGNYDEIAGIIFSPDSRHYALICRQNEEWMVVRDGKRGRRYQNIRNLVFSPDSGHITYMARKGRRTIVVKNNREYDQGHGALFPAFSPDSRRFAYLTMDRERNTRYIIDDKRGLVLGNPGKLIFSRDSSRVAYSAWIGGKWHVIADGKKGPAFEEITAYSFSPYKPELLLYAGKIEEGKMLVGVNDQKGKIYDSVGAPVFSPDGERLAYVAQSGEKMFVVVNGREGKPYPAIGVPGRDDQGKAVLTDQNPFFSPDGARMAYPVVSPEESQAFMVVDGKEHPPFDNIGRPHFSPDGNHVVYTAARNRKRLIVVDGHPGQTRVEGIIQGADIKFESDNRFYLLVAEQTDPGPSFFRLEVEIKPDRGSE